MLPAVEISRVDRWKSLQENHGTRKPADDQECEGTCSAIADTADWAWIACRGVCIFTSNGVSLCHVKSTKETEPLLLSLHPAFVHLSFPAACCSSCFRHYERRAQSRGFLSACDAPMTCRVSAVDIIDGIISNNQLHQPWLGSIVDINHQAA